MIKCTQTHAYGHAQIQFVRTQCNRISGELKMRLHRKHTAHTHTCTQASGICGFCMLPESYCIRSGNVEHSIYTLMRNTSHEERVCEAIMVNAKWAKKKQQHELLKWNNHIDEKQSQHEKDGKELECCFFDSVFSLYVNFGVSSSLSALLIAFGLCMLSPSRKVYSPMPIL